MNKPYRVRQTIDQSMRYFEASYLMQHVVRDAADDDDDDQPSRPAKSTPTSDTVQKQSSARSHDPRRTASIRCDSRFNYESVDDVTNVKRCIQCVPEMRLA